MAQYQAQYTYTLSTEDVAKLIPLHATEVCLFATYSPEARISRNVELFIKELAMHFSLVVVLTNNDRGGGLRDAMHAFPGHVRLCQVPNQCRDFGMWWQVLRMMSPTTHPNLLRVGLVNDSCSIIGPLAPLFDWARVRPQNERAFWGVTRSLENGEHLQSYFLVFEGQEATWELLAFAAATDIAPFLRRDKMALVRAFEIGLSQHMLRRGYKCNAFADLPMLQQVRGSNQRGNNPSYWLWEKLLIVGCPLLKKARSRIGNVDRIKTYTHPDFA